MKRNLLFLVLIVISAPLYSQNWAPINTTEKFCYAPVGGNEIITNVLWIDSTEQMGDHEIYYLNKIVAPCDTCSDSSYMLMNQPQFLLDKVKIYENNEWIFESYNQQFTLLPEANLNQVWLFDEENNITAEVVSEISIEVIGEQDSVKIISLSSGDGIALTKNHGILQWYTGPELIGIEGRDIGITVPMFEDMFSSIFEGDIICTYSYSSQIDGDYWIYNYDWMRYKITSINQFQDSVILEMNYNRKTSDDEYGYYCDYFQGDTVLKFYPNVYTESYPNQTISIDGYGTYSVAEMISYKFGGIAKSNKVFNNEQWASYSLFSQDYEFPNLLIPIHYDDWQKKYPVKYGFMELFNEGHEWSALDTIVGYLHNSDTLGIIFSENMFVGTNQLLNSTNWLIYPNPAKEFITLQFSENQDKADCKIYNVNGALLKEGKLYQSESSISIKELPKGMYFIELNINGELSTQKWIKN